MGRSRYSESQKHRIQLLAGFRVFRGRDDHLDQLDVLVGAVRAGFLARNHIGNEFLYGIVGDRPGMRDTLPSGNMHVKRGRHKL